MPAGAPSMSTEPGGRALERVRVLLSFERPAGESPRLRPRRTLKTAQLAKQTGSRQGPVLARSPAPARGSIHRQDIKGTWWMPWHQESMKGVDGCDKPR
jgi:hypothetical protein